MSLHLFNLQKAMYTTINNSDTISAEVYDDVPENAEYPYIVIGDDTTSDNGTKDLGGMTATVTMHIWSQYRGRKEVKQIMERLHVLLHNQDISVEGADLINCRQEFTSTVLDADGITRHGIMRFRVVVFDQN